jgi:hypothetical protein
MKILLLHPEDQLPAPTPGRRWDLIVDLGRAPAATYEKWSEQSGCRVFSLYDLAAGFEDLHHLRELLRLGMGGMVDESGIDWWDVLSLMIEQDLRQLVLISRLGRELEPDCNKSGCEFYASRSMPLATALQKLSGATVITLGSGFRPVVRWARHYRTVFSQLDATQFTQAFQDRFDREHRVRRRFARAIRISARPVVLMPSAYINVSRTAVSYAALLSEEKFLLIYARKSAELTHVPSNVSVESLDGYFRSTDSAESLSLAGKWEILRNRLISASPEFAAADASGLLERIPGLMHWGIAVRDAWNQVFKMRDVSACLCADDSNPYTRIPLILAKNRGVPTLVCHHGAMDSKMALKIPHGDTYLAKGEIESDYLLKRCGVDPEKVVVGGQGLQPALDAGKPGPLHSGEPWLVFFTEPYRAAGWREEPVYAELLPGLWGLAQSCGIKLVFKLHPFESVKGFRRILRKYLPTREKRIGVIGGPASAQLWGNTRIALTVQSTVALQCAALGIPVFLCSWLKDSTAGYVEQFAKFGIGHVLNSVDELTRIPGLLESGSKPVLVRPALWETVDRAKLRGLLLRTDSLPVALKA